jgi:DNA-binding NtrC family response regulator
MPQASILIVDDEEYIRDALRRELDTGDYELHFADSSQAAFEVLADRHIDIVISDNVMPGGMVGVQFLRVVRHLHPHVIRIMLTGQGSLETAVDAINKGEVFRFLEKPWEEAQLKTVLAAACQRIKVAVPAP